MIDPDNVPPIDGDESVTRFLFQKNHFRPGDETVRPEAFVPHPFEDLSVNRLRDASEDETWHVGHQISEKIQRSLKGRANVQVNVFQQQELGVEVAPIPENPNHANVINWPKEKAAQKAMAQAIARFATLVLE